MKRFHLDLGGLGMELGHSEELVHLCWDRPVEALSSALLGGGRRQLRSLLNLKVQHNTADSHRGFDAPSVILERTAEALGLPRPFAGMMTSASMKSFRWDQRYQQGFHVFAGLTIGITNARAAGDPADCILLEDHQAGSGTINLFVGTNAALSEAALAEALMLTAETRAMVMMDSHVKSAKSGRSASGTGTDSILVFSGDGPAVDFCGKHTLLGQLLAESVMAPLQETLQIIDELQKGLIRSEDLPLAGYTLP